MITSQELRAIAAARLQDAQVLIANQRYDGGMYIGGYAIELALKARICDTLGWQGGFPVTKGEFSGLASFKVHHLETLLHLTGREVALKQAYFKEWSAVTRWDPESRYHPVGFVSESDAQSFINAVTVLLQHI